MLLIILEDDGAEGGGNVEIWLGGVGGAPGGVKARLGLAFDAEKIGAPCMFGIERGSKTLQGDGEFGGPGFGGGIEHDAAMQFAVQFGDFAVRDIEVDPETVGGNFELGVFERIGGVGLQKSFGDVAIPELVAPAVLARVGVGVEVAKLAMKAKEKSFGSPEKAHFGGAGRIGVLTLPVMVELNRGSLGPSGFVGETFGVRFGGKPNGRDDRQMLGRIGARRSHCPNSVMQRGCGAEQQNGSGSAQCNGDTAKTFGRTGKVDRHDPVLP